jgi:hypothetical protein
MLVGKLIQLVGGPDEIVVAGNRDVVWATIVGHDSRRSSSTAGVGGTGNRTPASVAEGHQGEMKFFHGAFMVSYPVVDVTWLRRPALSCMAR